MAVLSTKLSAKAIKEEAEKIGLVWHDIEGIEVVHFDDGSTVIVAGDGEDARKLVEHLVALGMAEPT